jgi:chromosomal replication initiator protein
MHKSVQEITHKIAEMTGVTVSDILSTKRQSIVVMAKWLLILVLYRYTRLSFPAIGRMLGGRDHSTIVHALQSVEELLQDDKLFIMLANEICDWVETYGATVRERTDSKYLLNFRKREEPCNILIS